MHRFYPFLSRVFLRSHQILAVLHAIENQADVELIARSYVAKRYYGKRKAEVCYEHIGYKRAFDQVSEDKLWMHSIEVELRLDGSPEGVVRMSRTGIFSFYGLDFSRLSELFIKPTIRYLLDQYDRFLVNRSRSLKSLEVRPIIVKLSEDVFKQDGASNRLIDRLNKGLVRWGYSVLSQDENFVQIALHDYDSGSNFDLLVPRYDEIHIIPQTQVLPISFNRLLSTVLDNYEGELIDG